MIDDLDRKIIRVLNEDARKSYREMAKQLGISVTAVINRMKKFEYQPDSPYRASFETGKSS